MRIALTVVFVALALATPPTGDVHTERKQATGLTGQLLVATDALRDPRFHRTVIYLVHHGAAGALGVVVNRPLGDAPLAAILDEVGGSSAGISGKLRVHYGGPVEPHRGGVLHDTDSGLALTTTPAILEAIARGQGPARFIFVLGYAGWAPGQLEAEIASGAWITVPADAGLILDDDATTKWDRAMTRRRIRL
jgi:putative transcriptional regulator